MEHVTKHPSGCWHWTGHIDPRTGYGNIATGSRRDGTRRTELVHRFVYEVRHGQLPRRGEPGHVQVDHECHNRSKTCQGGPTCLHRRCVNPAHLAAKPAKENGAASEHSTASLNRAKTHCTVCQTELVEPNIYRAPNGARKCKPCAKRRSAESKARRAQVRGPVALGRPRGETCKYDHELSGDNLYVAPNGMRGCRTCRRDRARAHYLRSVGQA